jgi:hypothetical protein
MTKDADLLSSLKSNELMETDYYIVRYVNQLVAVFSYLSTDESKLEPSKVCLEFCVSKCFFL